ncbi:hypothetical protein JCM10213_008711 [Rhodosporidiobolus nylandii]
MSSSKRSHDDARSPPRDSHAYRRRRDEDDGEPWWEQDRRGGGGRGFDDEPPRRSGGGGGYYDRDAGGGLPYDDPPRRERDYPRGGGGAGRYDDRRERERYGAGSRGGSYRDRDGYSDRRERDYRRPQSVEQRSPPAPRAAQLPPAVPVASPPRAQEPKPSTRKAESEAEEGEVVPPPLDLTPSNADSELDAEAILAERRRKRAEILAKYASSAPTTAAPSAAATPAQVATPELSVKKEESEERGTPGRQEVERAAKRLRIGTDSPAVAPSPLGSTPAASTVPPSRASASVEPEAHAEAEGGVFALEKDGSSAADTEQASAARADGEAEVSAADYNPDGEDDDREKRERRVEHQAEGEGMQLDGQVEEEEEEEIEVEEEEDDEDDMFAIPSEKKEKKTVKRKVKKAGGAPLLSRALPSNTTNPSLLADNYDDPEGYYKVILGESLDNGRYQVVANLGKGMFSSVVKARDLGVDGQGKYEDEEGGTKGKGVGEGKVREVAIKLVRSQESMFKAALKEAQILRRLRDADPDDKKHLVRLLRTFEHRGHLCLVFESLSMNLREVVKRYGKNVGLNLRAVRAYASQMFLALALMKKCEIMHADLKPDNILVNESKSTLKVCDLGSASDVSENEITPYLVSRFYRAPEIILGLPYDCSLDVWSIACTLYELYTGKILFPGRTNNHMLFLIMETKGKFNHKLIRKARFHDQHFDENMNFLFTEKNDTVTPRAMQSKPPSDLRSRLMPAGVTRKLKDDEVRLLANFVDLLDKMLSLEPARRPTPKELLNHPFIRG